MNFLDKKVEEILKNHPSGEDFFNHLDDSRAQEYY